VQNAARSSIPEFVPPASAPQEARPPEPPKAIRKVATPKARRLSVYSDGAARGNPGPSGAGAVLFDEGGAVVERLGRYLGQNTNNYAEYMGLILGLERARELGATEVSVYADSQLMIRQLGGSYKVKAENLKPLYAEALALLRSFARFELHHVPREENAEADEMSNRAIDERM
jgi:ribonuclease HI